MFFFININTLNIFVIMLGKLIYLLFLHLDYQWCPLMLISIYAYNANHFIRLLNVIFIEYNFSYCTS